MKNEKGITLIALVITIIVMLIIVAVSVTIVMQGGLFNRAKTASLETQYAAEREELLIHTMGNAYDAMNNSLDLKKLAQDTYFTANWDIVSPASFSSVDDDTAQIVVRKKGSNSGFEYTIARTGARITDNATTILAQNAVISTENNIINNTNAIIGGNEGNNVVNGNNTSVLTDSVIGKYYMPRTLRR